MECHNIIFEIESYSKATGLAPSTICVRAIDNSRFYERALRRAKVLENQAERIRAYIAANPPPSDGEGA